MKDILRKKMVNLRQNIAPDKSISYSKKIAERLFSIDLYRHSKAVMAYMPFRGEVDTTSVIHHSLDNGKKIIIPVVQKKTKTLVLSELKDPDTELARGEYGIPEPLPRFVRPYNREDIDLILVPAVAYDLRGFRLGYGAGYYDRFLSTLKKPVPTIGLAFEIQVLTEVPTEATDIPVDYIITEKRFINCLDDRNKCDKQT